MNGENRVTLQWPLVIAACVLFVGLGAGGAYLALRPDSDAPTLAPRPADVAAPIEMPPGDVIITLTEESVKRAGLVVATAEAGGTSNVLRLPAVIEANAYKQVSVTPVVSGRVVGVMADLGAQVRQGQTMATVFSPALAEARTRYISAVAELEAHEKELARTTKLVEIGAASRQELERIHAEHSAQRARVGAERSQLELLGLPRVVIDRLASGKVPDSNVEVRAPITGVVIERLANVGLNVDPAAKLFTVVDLSAVWVVASLYEQDSARAHVGDRATVTLAAYPGRRIPGRVTYIDPQVSPESRTTKVRVEVNNPDRELRLGMLAEMEIEGAERTTATFLPKSAVQNVGDRSFVYLPRQEAATQFTEREVRLGQASGDRVEVVSGLAPGDQVVVEGSFFLRAERERLGLRSETGSASAADKVPAPVPSGASDTQAAKILVGDQGFHPAKVVLRANVPARLTFLRTSATTCATEVVLPSLNIKRALPLNEPVTVEFPPSRAGEIAFACGMSMFKGAILVE